MKTQVYLLKRLIGNQRPQHGCPGTAPVCLENPKQTLSKQYKAARCWLGLIIKVMARPLL